MTVLQKIKSDSLLQWGWIAIAVSTIIYLLSGAYPQQEASGFGFFLFNFAIAVFYFFVPKLGLAKKQEEHRIHYIMIRLILFLISAYALNRSIQILDALPLVHHSNEHLMYPLPGSCFLSPVTGLVGLPGLLSVGGSVGLIRSPIYLSFSLIPVTRPGFQSYGNDEGSPSPKLNHQ